MAIVRYTLDLDNPSPLTYKQRAQLANLALLTEDEINAAALSDPDNPPLTDEELALMVSSRAVRLARKATDLSQAEFAKTYQFTLGRLRDLEQGRTQADSAILAYLRLIERDPVGIKASLQAREALPA
jgi:putative transcriptional regulator